MPKNKSIWEEMPSPLEGGWAQVWRTDAVVPARPALRNPQTEIPVLHFFHPPWDKPRPSPCPPEKRRRSG